MSAPDGSDPTERARSIFERLRSADAEADAAPTPEPASVPDEVVGVAEVDRHEPEIEEWQPAGETTAEPPDVEPPAAEEPPPPASPPLSPIEDGTDVPVGARSEDPTEPPVPAGDADAGGADGEPAGEASVRAPVAPPAPAAPASDPAEVSPTISDGPTGSSHGGPQTPGDLAEELPAATVAPHERPAPRPLPRVLAVANQKGGVGKTTTAVNLGAGLAELGYRVLVVDLDPQGNATTGLGINSRNLDHSVYDVILHDLPLEDCIEPTTLRNLFVAPATIDLAGAEIELVPAFSRELRLRRALEALGDDFDFTLIDCPPSLGLLTVNGLAAASEVLVPIQCEYYALEGLGQLLRNVTLVQGNLNRNLEVSTIVLTMYDARTKLAEQVADEVRSHFGARVARNVVPRTVRLSEAPSFGQPIIVFDPSSRGALAYRELAKEVSGGAPQRTG